MKLVVSDLDGTLLNNESVVSEETKEIKKILSNLRGFLVNLKIYE